MGLQTLGKSVDPTILSSLSASLTVQYGVTIAPEMVATVPLNAPLYERITKVGGRKVKNDLAAVYAVLTAADFTGTGGGASFSAGGDPFSINAQRTMHALTKKSYGASGAVKDIDVIGSMTPGAPISLNADAFADDAEMLLALLYARTLQGIDYDTIKGSASSDSTAFDGLETKVTTGVSSYYVDKEGGTEISAALINQHIAWMMSGGVTPTAIYCHPVVHSGIVNAYGTRTNANIVISDGGVQRVGFWATSVVTPAGELPIISDPRFTISSNGTYVTGDVFFAVEQHNGVPILYYDWQVEPTAVPLGRVMGRGRATSNELAVWSHLVLVERTNWAVQGRLANVYMSFAPSVSSMTE